MRPIVTAAVVIAAILAACGQASAQGDAAQAAPRGRGGVLAMLDANKDGVVTKAEFDSSRTARFTALDASKDGVLSEAEMTAGRPNGANGPRVPMGARMMMRADANGDGKISNEEFAAGGALQWARMDVNKDGKVDPAELAGLRGVRRGGGPGNNGG